jgi:hypothetical protein
MEDFLLGKRETSSLPGGASRLHDAVLAGEGRDAQGLCGPEEGRLDRVEGG